MILYLYFFSYGLQFLSINFSFICFLLSCCILYDQIIKKKDDLFIIFLAILPTLSPLDLDNIRYDNLIYFFIFIDPIFIASLFTLYRNFLIINFRKLNYNFFLYIIIFIYALVNLIILYLSGQNDNQGLTYAFKAVVYISAIFTAYTNNFINFKNQVLKIIIFSIIIIYIREVVNLSDTKISGHLIFFITAFIPFIIFYKFKLLHLLIYLPSLLLISYQTTTLTIMFLFSHFLFFVRQIPLFYNNVSLIFLVNFQVICLILLLFINFFIGNYNPDSYFQTKFLFDRAPLYIAAIENLEYFNFNLKTLTITSENTLPLSNNNSWSSGAHNYFLTMSIKLGLIPSFIILIIINLFLIKLYNNIKSNFIFVDNFPKLLFISCIATFAVLSSVGNGYAENVGYLFFLLLGCLNSAINLKENNKIEPQKK